MCLLINLNKILQLTCWKYYQDIVDGKIIANKWVKLLAMRMLRDLERSKDSDFPYYFDYGKAIAIEGFIGTLKFTEGLKVNQTMELAPFQNAIVVSQFCWRFKSEPDKLRFKDTIVFISRKNGKSYIISLLSILAIMLEANGEAVAGAGKYEQAKIMVRQAMRMIQSNPRLAKNFKILTSEIRFQGSTFKPLPSNPAKLDGISPHFVCFDEAMIIDCALRDSLISGGMMRKNVSNFYISTEYQQEFKTGWFDELLDYGKKVLEGVLEDDRLLPFIYCLDNAEEVHDENMWIKANPILSDIPSDFLREMYNQAKESPALMKNLLIKNFNVSQITNSDNSYLSMDKWKACRSEEPIDWKGIHVNVGVDLSKTTDLTAVSFTGTDEEGNVLVHSHGFLPEDSLLSGNRREKIDYRRLEKEGCCTITEGAIVDYDIVKEYIINIESKFGCIIDSIQFDMYNALMMANELAQEGFNVVECKQNILTLSYPTKTFREKVYLGQVKYDKNELLDWCVSCAITEEDRNGNEKISKNKSQKNNKRIDLIAATIFSYAETVKTEIKPKFNIDAFGIIDC